MTKQNKTKNYIEMTWKANDKSTRQNYSNLK